MKIRYNGKLHEVYLCDDGTMDTVIKVDGEVHRFDSEYASHVYRRRNGELTKRGLRGLALEVLGQ